MDILSALNVLQAASDENLRAHAGETILTLRTIGERLQVNLLSKAPYENTIEDATSTLASSSIPLIPSGPHTGILSGSLSQNEIESRHGNSTWEPRQTDCHPTGETVSFRSNDIISTQTTQDGKDHKPKKDAVSGLSSAIKRTIPWLWETSKKNLNLSNKTKPDEDPRLNDFRSIEGESKPSEQDKLLRLLAIRSLALEFTAEQMAENSQTKVDELVESLRSMEISDETVIKAKGRRSGVSDFIKSHPHLSVSSDLANKAINSGIKHLVFEKALIYRLQEQDLPSQVEVVSAILGQSINNFKNLSYKGMSDVLDALLSDKSKLSLPDDRGWENEYSMMDVIRSANEWFIRLQAEYNDFRSRVFLAQREEPFAKRARHNRSNFASQEYSPPQSDNDEPFQTNQANGETCAEGGLDEPFPNQNSLQPENFDPFGNFNPLEDAALFQDFNPLEDIELFQDFNPLEDIELFQDFNPLEDIHMPHFDFPNLSAEKTTSAVSATVDQVVEFDRLDDRDATFPTSTNNPQLQSV